MHKFFAIPFLGSHSCRILKLENIFQRLEGIQPENTEPTTAKPNLQKWGKGSVRGCGTTTEPLNPPANYQEDMEECFKAVIVAILIVVFEGFLLLSYI